MRWRWKVIYIQETFGSPQRVVKVAVRSGIRTFATADMGSCNEPLVQFTVFDITVGERAVEAKQRMHGQNRD